ncbi:MAG: hypothetical protein ABJA98_10885 [Acidobacteriota bacterium]
MRAVHVVALAWLALMPTGCARLHARAEPISPPLEIPAPPPRVITTTLPATATATATTEAIPADPLPAAPELPAEAGPRRPPRGAPAAPAARQEKPPEVPAPVPARPAATSPPPSPTLQTTTKVEEVEQRVRVTIAQASRDLGRINSRALNAEAKAQYDIAKRFVEQAGDALRAKNFVFAGQLADKASTLATLLLAQ